MNATKLRQIIKSKHKSIMAFCETVDVPYTTLMTAMESDKKLDNMSIQNFIKIAHALGMTADELIEKIK